MIQLLSLRTLRPLRAALFLAVLTSISSCRDLDRPPRVGDTLPDFEAPLRSGEMLSFADLKGGPALINLWATWCPPCRSETPYLERLSRELGPHGLQVLGISVDNRSARESVDYFLNEAGAEYRQMLDPQMGSMDLFGVIGLPATFIVNAEGEITYYDFGPVDDGDPAFAAALAALLPEGVRIPASMEDDAGGAGSVEGDAGDGGPGEANAGQAATEAGGTER